MACHQFFSFSSPRHAQKSRPGGTFLLKRPTVPERNLDKIPQKVQEQIIEKKLRFFCIDAYKVARDNGMGNRINTVMQTCFFAISDILPPDKAVLLIKAGIKKTYGNKGEKVLQSNYQAVDNSVENLYEVDVPGSVSSSIPMRPPVPEEAPEYVAARVIA